MPFVINPFTGNFDNTGSGGVTPASGVQLLSTTDNIDATVVGQTALYTVPVGKSLVVDHIIVRTTNDDTYVGSPTFSVGISPNFTEIINGAPYSTQSTTGIYQGFLLGGNGIVNNPPVLPAGDVVTLDITAGATATALVISVDLFGYLI